MRHPVFSTAAIAVLVAALTTACSAGDEAAASCENQTLKIGESTGLSLIYAPLYVAEKKGFLTDEKVKVKHIQLGGGSESIQALVGGSIDIVATPFASIASARAEGAPLVAFASFSNRNTADVGIKTAAAPPADADLDTKVRALKGKKVGVTSPGSGSDQTLRYLAKKAGLDPDKDLTIIATGGSSETVAAFSRGSIDAFIIGAPASDVAAARGKGTLLLRLAEGPVPEFNDILYGAVATSERTLKSKGPLLECYARALDKADRFIRDNPEEAGDVLRGDFADMNDDDFDATWAATVASTPRSAAIKKAEADKAADFLAVVTGEDSVDVSDAYTEQFNGALN